MICEFCEGECVVLIHGFCVDCHMTAISLKPCCEFCRNNSAEIVEGFCLDCHTEEMVKDFFVDVVGNFQGFGEENSATFAEWLKRKHSEG